MSPLPLQIMQNIGSESVCMGYINSKKSLSFNVTLNIMNFTFSYVRRRGNGEAESENGKSIYT